jgi:putative transposase
MPLAPQSIRTYLLTFVTAQRRRVFQVEAHAQMMLQLLQEHRAKGRFALYAFVVMPDHLHVLLTPAPEVSLEKAVQYIKGGFSFQLKSRMEVWERGYHAAQVKTAAQFEAFQVYIEHNPVRKRMVARTEEFMYSSAGKAELVDPRPAWFGRG